MNLYASSDERNLNLFLGSEEKVSKPVSLELARSESIKEFPEVIAPLRARIHVCFLASL